MTRVTGRFRGDVVVVGGGLVGLASALALADDGTHVVLVDDDRPGQASRASGGVLAPSIDPAPGGAGSTAFAALARYPAFLDALHERTGRRVALGRGVLQVARSEHDADRMRAGLGIRGDAGVGAGWLDAAGVRALEPTLRATHGALLHALDGWVDAPDLLDALREAVSRTRRIRTVRATATELRTRRTVARVALTDGGHAVGGHVVVATGAWSPLLGGRHRGSLVRPLRGQMIAVPPVVGRHAVFGAGGYLVPSGRGTLVGATSEATGFDGGTTAGAADELRLVLASLAPGCAGAPVLRHWSGIRPMTADGQPLIGPDPARPVIVYACGHSRNGVLLAAITGACVAALVAGTEPPVNLGPFAPERFDVGAGTSAG